MVAELSYYRKSGRRPIIYQCQVCDEVFSLSVDLYCCPNCLSRERSSIIVLHMEDDPERDEMLTRADFSAGD